MKFLVDLFLHGKIRFYRHPEFPDTDDGGPSDERRNTDLETILEEDMRGREDVRKLVEDHITENHMTIIYAILIFCLLIFVHEFGHFIAAKACGVKVNEFAIGMGPAFFKKQKGETQYSLRAFPIGGFCAMEGEDEDSEDERAFNNKPAWQRACVLAAGPFMNLLTAMLLLGVIATWAGQPTTTVSQVLDDSPAYEAGIQAGDEILSVDGTKIEEWNDLLTVVSQTKRYGLL